MGLFYNCEFRKKRNLAEYKMPRRGRAMSPAPRAPPAPAPRAAAPPPSPPAQVPAHAPPAAPAPMMAQPQQPSLFKQMAATAGGVAVDQQLDTLPDQLLQE